jgi:hypothetical protein
MMFSEELIKYPLPAFLEGRCEPSVFYKWINIKAEEYKKQFALMPTADHINPDKLEFEMCSWLVNECKSYLSPDEFVALCQKIVNHRNPPPAAPALSP